MGGQGGQLPTQVLADQLTLSQPKGANTTTLLLAHSASFLRHCLYLCTHFNVVTKVFLTTKRYSWDDDLTKKVSHSKSNENVPQPVEDFLSHNIMKIMKQSQEKSNNKLTMKNRRQNPAISI